MLGLLLLLEILEFGLGMVTGVDGTLVVVLLFLVSLETSFTSMVNLIPPRQCPDTSQINQYVLASMSLTSSFPLLYFAKTPLFESHDRYASSVTS